MDSPLNAEADKLNKPSTDMVASLEETKDPVQENMELNPVVAWVKGRFQRNKDKRQPDEQRWLDAYRNFRGIYDGSVVFSDEEQSKVFIKITKTKVLAAVAQMGDVLFAGNKFPIGIEPTPDPLSDKPDKINIEFSPAGQMQGQSPQSGPQQTPTIARPELVANLLPQGAEQFEDKLQEGPGLTPSSVTWEPIKIAAKKMETKIHDQLEESDASKYLRYMAFEMALFGTGIMKGPSAIQKEYPSWEPEMDEENNPTGNSNYNPKFKTIPKINSVSIWNFYPDADAHNMNECDGVIERHKMSEYDVRMLKKRPFFRKDSIDEAIRRGYNYQPEYWESIIEDNFTSTVIERYEVLEYWGNISRDIAEENGLDIPSDFDAMDDFQVNIWICNDQILRLVLNPYTPNIIPYYATPYEVNPYSFFGVGVAENMNDTQELMNGFMRMAVDNAALSGNIIIEVDETNLVPGQDMKVYPGKIFRRQGGAPGQAIYGTKFPNITQEIMLMYDKARQITDEATNMPSYAHGSTDVQGMGRTAAGMSMLMGAAAQSIKAVVRNIDDYFLSPVGKNLFAFNMQFDYDEDIKGDLDVVAKGTESLMRNEVRSQKLLQFMQVGLANPVTAPMIKADYILRELATAMDLDEDMIVNDQRAMIVQAQLIKEMQQVMGNALPQGPTNKQGGPPSPSDPTGNGGGNIGPGSAPEPGSQGYTGSGGGDNGGPKGRQQAQMSSKADSATIQS